MTAFEQWFSGDWQKLLHSVPDDRTVLSSGFTIATASWDRRAAYLLWVELGKPDASWVQQMRRFKETLAKQPPPTFAPIAKDIEDLLS